MLNVRSDLSNSFGEEEGEQIDLLMVDSEEPDPVEGGAEFLPNNGLSLFLVFGLGERSLFNDLLFGLGVRLNILLKLALKLDEEVEETFSLFSSVSFVFVVLLGHDEDLCDVGGDFDFVGGLGGMVTKIAGGSGTAVSFNFTTTLSTLPSRCERVSLLNKVLN
jgi:hypothetical protein